MRQVTLDEDLLLVCRQSPADSGSPGTRLARAIKEQNWRETILHAPCILQAISQISRPYVIENIPTRANNQVWTVLKKVSGKIFIELNSRLGGVTWEALLVAQKVVVPRRDLSIVSPHKPVWNFVRINSIARR